MYNKIFRYIVKGCVTSMSSVALLLLFSIFRASSQGSIARTTAKLPYPIRPFLEAGKSELNSLKIVKFLVISSIFV